MAELDFGKANPGEWKLFGYQDFRQSDGTEGLDNQWSAFGRGVLGKCDFRDLRIQVAVVNRPLIAGE